MGSFVVSARKYRPLRFDEVVGQGHVATTLKNAIRQDTLAHAFLFCGPRGVGKTTCARILAKVLNCQNVSEDTEPCGTCSSCEAFDKNASLNILELDAASHNSVEHIRSLTEQVRFQPQQGDYKIFIIDEVHMLSQQAFNAFLKTLEEPPSYAIFILATTEKHKIIPTILSRCQIFDFKRIQVNDIVTQLNDICEKEEIDADSEALHMIASKADGALRDALSIFDKIASYGSKKISYDDVIQNLNILDYDVYFKIVEALANNDLAAILAQFDLVQKEGFEGDVFVNGLADHFRNLLVCKHEAIQHLLTLSEGLSQRYIAQAAKTDEAFILSALDILNNCDVEYKMARNKRLHVEMALIKLNYLLYQVDLGSAELLEEKKTPDFKGTVITSQISIEPALDVSPVTLNSPRDASSKGEAQSREELITKTPEVVESTRSGADAKTDLVGQPEGQGKVLNIKPTGLAISSIGTLDQIEKVAEARYAEHREMQGQVVALEQVESIWQNYASQQSSQTVKTVLERVQLDVKNNAIVATVTSEISKTVVLQETALIDSLRSELGLPKLTIKIEIDQDAAQHIQTPKVLTIREKFALLCEQNPHFKSFQDQFGLKVDRDQA